MSTFNIVDIMNNPKLVIVYNQKTGSASWQQVGVRGQ